MGKLLDIDTYETYMDQQNELIGVIAENSSTKLKSKITTPATGDIGHVLSVNSVDSDGKPKTWIASDIDDILEYSDVVSGKVDKMTGKSLSTNDYDNSAKAKVDAIPSNPKYTDTIYDDTEITENISTLSEDLVELITKDKWNLAEDAELITNKFVSNEQTVGSVVVETTNNIYTYAKIPITPNTHIYFLADKYKTTYGASGYNGKNACRFGVFVDADNKFIEGYSYPQPNSARYIVPSNAKYFLMSFATKDEREVADDLSNVDTYWCTTRAENDHVDRIDLNDSIITKQLITNMEERVDELEEDVEELSDIKTDVEYAFTRTKWNLASDAELLDNTYFVAGGTTKTLNNFGILSGITGIEGKQYLYVYTQFTGSSYNGDGYNGKYTCRGYRFYDADDNMISELINYTTSPIVIPTGAVKCDIQCQYVNSTTKLGEHWVTIEPQNEHYDKVVLNHSKNVDDINKNKADITDIKKALSNQSILSPVQLVRKPTFVFTFDDGTDGDVNTKALFDSYGFKCGFALLSSNSNTRYLDWQNEGYEILSHSINGTAFEQVTDEEMIESYLKDSLKTLKGKGYNITGWVTPSTTMNPSHIPYVEKYYQYAFGHLRATATESYHTLTSRDLRKLERWSLQSNTVESTMAEINNCITNNGIMIFYGHSYPQTSDYMTVENMKTILDYLKAKVDDEQIYVLPPREAINNYYSLRWSELVGLLN